MSVTAVIGSVDRDAKEGGNVRRIEVERVVVHHKWIEYQKQELEEKKRLDSIKRQLMEWEFSGRDIDNEFKAKVKKYKTDAEWVDKAIAYVYNNKNYYDIALLKLKDRIVPVFNETHYIINSICLPESGIVNKEPENVMIIGMGATDENYTNKHKLKKGLDLMLSPDYCYYFDKEGGPKTPICHWGTNINRSTLLLVNSSTCSGDSGSPTHQYYGWNAVQIGITSSNYRVCGKAGWPSLKIRVSLFMPWIRSVISGTDVHIEAEASEQLTTEDNSLITICLIIGFITLFVTIRLLFGVSLDTYRSAPGESMLKYIILDSTLVLNIFNQKFIHKLKLSAK